jgi:hypothetical protein
MSDTPRMESAAGHARGIVDYAIFAEGMKIERELNASNERIKRLEAFLAEVSRRWECECHYAIQQECDCCRAEGLLKEANP